MIQWLSALDVHPLLIMSTLSDTLTWEQTNDELGALKTCLIHLHELSSDFKKNPTEALIKQTLCTLVADRCTKLNYIRIQLNQQR